MSEAPIRMRDLTQGPVTRTLIAFALPSLLVNVLQSANGTIASIFVGKMLGEAALAATANANMIMFVVFATIFGFAMAATIVIGHAVGRRDMDEVKRTTGASVGLFLIVGVLISALGWWGTPAFLKLLATPEEVIGPASAYMRVIFLGLPVSFINMLLPSLLRGIGDAVSPLRATIVNLTVGICSCPLLIMAIGIEGAALAAFFANVASVAFQIWHVYRHDMAIALRGADLHLLKPDWGHARPLIVLGFPMGLSMILMGISQMGMIGLINREGMNTVAAYGAINQLWGFLQMPAIAVGGAVSAMAAQNIGAGHWHRINRIALSGIGINMLMCAVLVTLITLFQRPLLGMFLPAASPAIEIGAHINTLLGWTHVFLGVSTIVTSLVRANGAMFWPLVILICSAIFLRFAVGLLGYPYWGADAIWASFAAHAFVSTLWSLAYFRWGRWREKSVPGGRALDSDEIKLFRSS